MNHILTPLLFLTMLITTSHLAASSTGANDDDMTEQKTTQTLTKQINVFYKELDFTKFHGDKQYYTPAPNQNELGTLAADALVAQFPRFCNAALEGNLWGLEWMINTEKVTTDHQNARDLNTLYLLLVETWFVASVVNNKKFKMPFPAYLPAPCRGDVLRQAKRILFVHALETLSKNLPVDLRMKGSYGQMSADALERTDLNNPSKVEELIGTVIGTHHHALRYQWAQKPLREQISISNIFIDGILHKCMGFLANIFPEQQQGFSLFYLTLKPKELMTQQDPQESMEYLSDFFDQLKSSNDHPKAFRDYVEHIVMGTFSWKWEDKTPFENDDDRRDYLLEACKNLAKKQGQKKDFVMKQFHLVVAQYGVSDGQRYVDPYGNKFLPKDPKKGISAYCKTLREIIEEPSRSLAKYYYAMFLQRDEIQTNFEGRNVKGNTREAAKALYLESKTIQGLERYLKMVEEDERAASSGSTDAETSEEDEETEAHTDTDETKHSHKTVEATVTDHLLDLDEQNAKTQPSPAAPAAASSSEEEGNVVAESAEEKESEEWNVPASSKKSNKRARPAVNTSEETSEPHSKKSTVGPAPQAKPVTVTFTPKLRNNMEKRPQEAADEIVQLVARGEVWGHHGAHELAKGARGQLKVVAYNLSSNGERLVGLYHKKEGTFEVISSRGHYKDIRQFGF